MADVTIDATDLLELVALTRELDERRTIGKLSGLDEGDHRLLDRLERDAVTAGGVHPAHVDRCVRG